MKFSRLAIAALGISFVAHLGEAASLWPWWCLALVNVAVLLALWLQAVNLHRRRVPGFDVIVAAETIVAFGIMSLILGLAVALLPIVTGIGALDIASPGALGQLALPFLVGLGTAGVAPFFAMLLRNQSAEDDAIVDPVGDASDLAKAMGALRKELVDVEKTMKSFHETAASAGRATSNLADVVDTETGRLKIALLEGQSGVRSLGAAAETGSQQVSKLSGETQRLTKASSEAAALLDALAALIAAVERFVAPATSGRR